MTTPVSIHSVRFFIRWGGEARQPDVECVTENCGHLSIETKPGDDGALFLQLSVRPDTSPVGSKSDDVHGAEIKPAHQPVNDQLATLGQVNVHDFRSIFGHCNQPFQNSPAISYQQVPGIVRKEAA